MFTNIWIEHISYSRCSWCCGYFKQTGAMSLASVNHCKSAPSQSHYYWPAPPTYTNIMMMMMMIMMIMMMIIIIFLHNPKHKLQNHNHNNQSMTITGRMSGAEQESQEVKRGQARSVLPLFLTSLSFCRILSYIPYLWSNEICSKQTLFNLHLLITNQYHTTKSNH